MQKLQIHSVCPFSFTLTAQFFVRNCGRPGLVAAENSQIKTELETATEVSGADWGGANNPYDDINGVIATIEANYPVHFIAAHPLVWGDFFSNDKVKFAVSAGGLIQFPTTKTFLVPGLPGLSCGLPVPMKGRRNARTSLHQEIL